MFGASLLREERQLPAYLVLLLMKQVHPVKERVQFMSDPLTFALVLRIFYHELRLVFLYIP